jgi:hypothetical protein
MTPPQVVKELQTIPVESDPPLDPRQGLALMVERLAANPNVDVAKLERLIEMQERILAHHARAAFNGAFSAMQGEIPAIIERQKTNNGTYAPLEDIQAVLRPILMKHGFSLSFRTEWPDAKTVKVIGILTHRDGHQRESEFLSGADTSGNKNAIQGLGSAVTYGRRYTTRDLLNITTRGADDDGHMQPSGKPEAPAGYDDWLIDLTSCADEGDAKLRATWEASKVSYRAYLTKGAPAVWAGLKAKALQATIAAKGSK